MSIIRKILNEKPWSSSSDFFIPFHMIIWILIIMFAIWLDEKGGSTDDIHYIDPIHNETTERMS